MVTLIFTAESAKLFESLHLYAFYDVDMDNKKTIGQSGLMLLFYVCFSYIYSNSLRGKHGCFIS